MRKNTPSAKALLVKAGLMRLPLTEATATIIMVIGLPSQR